MSDAASQRAEFRFDRQFVKEKDSVSAFLIGSGHSAYPTSGRPQNTPGRPVSGPEDFTLVRNDYR
jgi:hypothetical protein